MRFRLATIDGRAALVDGDNDYDLALRERSFDADPMAALLRTSELSTAAASASA